MPPPTFRFLLAATGSSDMTGPPFSWTIFIVLSIVFIASVLVFGALVRRSTISRDRVALAEWARGRRFALRPTDEFPAPLEVLSKLHPDLHYRIFCKATNTTIVRLTTDVPERAAQIWHLAIRALDAKWPPTGLRPSQEPTSALDIFSLSSFPTFGSRDRFTVFGTDSTAARAVSDSSSAALLPPDIGLLLHGQSVVLDFSGRPFDAIEFDRMLVLLEQIVRHLPTVPQ